MKIYTKTGDLGETGLFAGPRVRKDDARIEAYGTVDELNSVLGIARVQPGVAAFDELLGRIQHELFALGAELATPDPVPGVTQLISDPHIEVLEQAIDQWEARLAPLVNFIIPGGSPLAAHLHLARTVCRRAERHVVSLVFAPAHPASSRIVQYLNRLGDLLFVLARAANAELGVADVAWRKPGNS